jgi:hypothetical protein
MAGSKWQTAPLGGLTMIVFADRGSIEVPTKPIGHYPIPVCAEQISSTRIARHTAADALELFAGCSKWQPFAKIAQ